MPKGALAPDGTAARIEEVIGYRGWDISHNGPNGEIRLESPVFDLTWAPGQWQVAECHSVNGQMEAHGPNNPDPALWSPVKSCGDGAHGCGFYAGRTREHLIQLGYGRYSEHHPRVIGQVQMAGKIIPASNGWRAQRVLVRTIYVPFEAWKMAAEIKAEYGPHGVEVECKATTVLDKGALLWCVKCGGKMRRDPKCPTCGHTHT